MSNSQRPKTPEKEPTKRFGTPEKKKAYGTGATMPVLAADKYAEIELPDGEGGIAEGRVHALRVAGVVGGIGDL